MERIANNYAQFVEEYADVFGPLFEKAYEISEFNLIMSILAVRGMSDDGWIPFENTEHVFEEVYKQQGKLQGTLGFNINLWMYVHLIECSEHYELVANLLNTVKGKDYIVANHKNKHFANLKVEQKIDRLKSIARGTEFENVSLPFERTFNGRFRNAIAHADYSIKQTGRTGVTIVDDAGYPTIIDLQKTNDLVNRAVALHVVLRSLLKQYRSRYRQSTVIKSSPSFGHGAPIDITLIVRKNYGVIGFRCIGGYDLGKPFETRLVVCLPYELKLIKQGINDLPPSRVDRVNKVLSLMPRRLAVPVAKHLTKRLGID